MEDIGMSNNYNTNNNKSGSLLDSIRRTIEDRNLLTARTRIRYVSAMRNAYRATRNSKNINNIDEISIEARVAKLKAKITQELVLSEKNYLKQLTIIIDKFKGNVEGILQKKELDSKFT